MRANRRGKKRACNTQGLNRLLAHYKSAFMTTIYKSNPISLRKYFFSKSMSLAPAKDRARGFFLVGSVRADSDDTTATGQGSAHRQLLSLRGK